MTALVAVLNKHAVAIAADSAVTMGNTHKVVNSANKIFTLSKYHPVAVMTYNNASFMGTPWDIIIKEYRKQLKDTCYSTVRDYINDFLKFLHNNHFFCSEETQKRYMLLLLDSFFEICREEIKHDKLIEYDKQTEADIVQKLQECLATNKSADKCDEFKQYKYGDFKYYAFAEIEAYAKGKGLKDIDILCESFFHYLTAKFSDSSFTGLVFVG